MVVRERFINPFLCLLIKRLLIRRDGVTLERTEGRLTESKPDISDILRGPFVIKEGEQNLTDKREDEDTLIVGIKYAELNAICIRENQ